jgi:deoxyribonuclease IV
MAIPLVIGWHTSLSTIEIPSYFVSGSKAVPAAQVFLKSPMGKASIRISEKVLAAARPLLDQMYLVVHGQYLINFIRPGLEWAIDSVVEDLLYLDAMLDDSPNKSRTGVVIHLGKNTIGLSLEECIENFTQNVKTVIERTPDATVRLILETSTRAKNGNDVFYSIENFGKLARKIQEVLGEEVYLQRIGFCVDTAHIFASGYSIKTRDEVRRFLQLWDDHIGVQRITLLHLNDSKVGVGCCRDLHEQLGKGMIYSEKKEGLAFLLEWCRQAMIPVVIESGGNAEEEWSLLRHTIDVDP